MVYLMEIFSEFANGVSGGEGGRGNFQCRSTTANLNKNISMGVSCILQNAFYKRRVGCISRDAFQKEISWSVLQDVNFKV